jgi:hypothetical protein
MDKSSAKSSKSSVESSRQYERLLKGEITSKQYVQTLRKESRSQVASQRASSNGRVVKRRTAA